MSQTRSTGMDTRGHIQRGYLGNSERSANNVSWLFWRRLQKRLQKTWQYPIESKDDKRENIRYRRSSQSYDAWGWSSPPARAVINVILRHQVMWWGALGVVPLNALFFSTRVSNLVLQLLCNLIWTCSVKFGLLCFSTSTSTSSSSSSFYFPDPSLHSILFSLFPILLSRLCQLLNFEFIISWLPRQQPKSLLGL